MRILNDWKCTSTMCWILLTRWSCHSFAGTSSHCIVLFEAVRFRWHWRKKITFSPMMQKEEPMLPFDVTSCRRTAVEPVIDGGEFETCGRIQEAWQLPALNFNHLKINVQGVPQRKKQESRLKLKRKKVKWLLLWTLFLMRFEQFHSKKRMLLLPAVVLLC